MPYFDEEIHKQYLEFKNCNHNCDEIKQQLIKLIIEHDHYVAVRSGPPHYEIYQNVYYLNRDNMLVSYENKCLMERRRF